MNVSQEFLKDLYELSRRHGIVIESANLEPMPATGYYLYDPAFPQVMWIPEDNQDAGEISASPHYPVYESAA